MRRNAAGIINRRRQQQTSSLPIWRNSSASGGFSSEDDVITSDNHSYSDLASVELSVLESHSQRSVALSNPSLLETGSINLPEAAGNPCVQLQYSRTRHTLHHM